MDAIIVVQRNLEIYVKKKSRAKIYKKIPTLKTENIETGRTKVIQ